MSGTSTPTAPPASGESDGTVTISGIIIRLLGLAVIDVLAIWLITNMFLDGLWPLATVLVIIIIFVNVAFLRERMYPLRWMVIGLSLMTLLSVYPILYTVFISLTNYGDGHLLTKQQSIEQLQRQTYLPEGGGAYSWTAYRTDDGRFALWLVDGEGNGFVAYPDQPLEEVTDPGQFGELDAEDIPLALGEFGERLNRLQVVPLIDQLGAINFGVEPDIVRIRNLDAAASTQQRFMYDEANDTLTDLSTGNVYTPQQGTWISADGGTVPPGFWVGIGLENFTRFFQSSAIGSSLILVTIWNFIFPLASVATTFFLGLFTAMLFNDLPGRRIIRSLLIIPYTIPSLVTILVWRGMLNEQLGVITNILEATIGVSPPWFNDPTWAKIGVLLVNLWLGYPYFMLVCSGALQGIPQDIYSAADVDGANAWQKFWQLTMPLLLVAVGPLLVASYVFNFNNFNIIFLYNSGGPPIANAGTPVGHTDILISYVYNLAFGGARGADYGFASAISIIIFVVVIVITLFQFRYTNMWEEAT